MATIVNIKPNDPWAGFGEAFNRALDRKAQAKMQADAQQAALDGKLKLMQTELTLKNRDRERREEQLSALIGAANTLDTQAAPPSNEELLGQLMQGTGVEPSPKIPMRADEPDNKTPSLARPQYMESQTTAKAKLGAKGLMVDPRFPGVAITPAQKLKADELNRSSQYKGMQARNEFLKLQMDVSKFNTSQEKKQAEDLMITNGANSIVKNKLFDSMLEDMDGEDKMQKAQNLASYLNSNDKPLLIALVTGQKTWVNKSALETGVNAESLVAPGTAGALPLEKFTKLYTEKQDNLSAKVKNHRLQFREWAIGKKWVENAEDFEENFPVGSVQRGRLEGWYNYMADLAGKSNDVFKSGQTTIEGFRELTTIEEKKFKLAFEQTMLDTMEILADGTYQDGIDIADVDQYSNIIKRNLLDKMGKALAISNKSERRSAVKTVLDEKNMKAMIMDSAWKMKDSGMLGEQVTAAYAGMKGDYVPSSSWQDVIRDSSGETLTENGKEIPGSMIWLDPNSPRREKWISRMEKLFPEDADLIRSAVSNPTVMLSIIQSGQR